MSIDVCRFAAAFRTKLRGDLVPLARHPLDNLVGYGGAIFAAFEPLIEQLDPESFDLLPRPIRNLLLNRAATQLDIGNVGWQDSPKFLELGVAQRFSPFR